jgi:hypothetical protein
LFGVTTFRRAVNMFHPSFQSSCPVQRCAVRCASA